MAKMILTNGYYAAEKGSWNWLTDGSSKFSYKTNISFWFADLPTLTDGLWMFQYCDNLRSFSGDLSSLTNGAYMFYGCYNLTSYNGNLSSLTDGYSMFSGCKLDLASVQNIANTINTVSSGTIGIGMSSTIQDTADLNTALEAIRAKGWTVEEQYNS